MCDQTCDHGHSVGTRRSLSQVGPVPTQLRSAAPTSQVKLASSLVYVTDQNSRRRREPPKPESVSLKLCIPSAGEPLLCGWVAGKERWSEMERGGGGCTDGRARTDFTSTLYSSELLHPFALACFFLRARACLLCKPSTAVPPARGGVDPSLSAEQKSIEFDLLNIIFWTTNSFPKCQLNKL